jgi:hypothetical protein
LDLINGIIQNKDNLYLKKFKQWNELFKGYLKLII